MTSNPEPELVRFARTVRNWRLMEATDKDVIVGVVFIDAKRRDVPDLRSLAKLVELALFLRRREADARRAGHEHGKLHSYLLDVLRRIDQRVDRILVAAEPEQRTLPFGGPSIDETVNRYSGRRSQ